MKGCCRENVREVEKTGAASGAARSMRCSKDENFGSRHLLEELPKFCPCGKSHGNVFTNILGTKRRVLMNWVLAPPVNKSGRHLKKRPSE